MIKGTFVPGDKCETVNQYRNFIK